jgi:hypothetical protein
MNTPLLDEYATRAVGTLTDTELDALSTEMNDHTGCFICREGFSDYHLGWTTWSWTPDGYRPHTQGTTTRWPLAPYLPISQVAELATLLHQSLPQS